MHDFKFRKNELFCENVKVRSIAQKVGTPFYCYSYKTFIDHFQKIQKAFKEVNPTVCFAVKSNSNLAVLKALADKGAGFDIVSGGELKKVLKIKADPQKIAYASVGKTDNEITTALKAGILFFNVESLPELKRIDLIAQKMKKKAPVALRINPDVEAPTHKAITTGTLKNKFGIDLKTAREILTHQEKYPFIKFKGIHIHIGSQITKIDPFVSAIQKMIKFLETLKNLGVTLEYFDVGGGIGIMYYDTPTPTAEEFAKEMVPLLKKTGMKIVLEPGRFISGNSGILVSKVLYLKDNGAKKFLIVDAGMNDLIRPALYNSYHNIVPVKKSSAKRSTMDIVGPICESGDFFAKDRKFPELKNGDLIAIMSAGAYGHVMSSNYNVRPRVPEILVKGKQWEVVRKRETFEDLIKKESIPKFLK
ncbi:MAG TPA: diaminopimelate decarboxylase [Candidatus Omnitrophota bacterium]|nr:diaminopimelate decarboxylase [Candidatus Omnitrophota bacterium]